MSIKNTKRNERSIYYIKYVTCATVLQDLNILDQILLLFLFWSMLKDFVNIDVPLFDKVKQNYLKTR